MTHPLLQELYTFLRRNGLQVAEVPVGDLILLEVSFQNAGRQQVTKILPVPLTARTPQEAEVQSVDRRQRVQPPVITLPEDRWRSQRALYEARLLSHMGIFHNIFARNCEVRRIDRLKANAFLDQHHNYGAAACRHAYGLFLKRSTGVSEQGNGLERGTMVAVATFSNARRWVKGERTVRSHEWVRYACLSGYRVAGGMGKVLKQFIKEVQPDDIMTYADLEWSDGGVYRTLGFAQDGEKEPVLFRISPRDWKRVPVRKESCSTADGCSSGLEEETLWYKNAGSLKFRLKLTDYQ